MIFKRLFNWIVGVPLAVLAIVFAVANRQWITVSLDPIQRDAPRISIDMPMWVLLFCGIFLGIMAGWLATWFAQGKWRRATRNARLELMRLQNEYERVKRERQSRNLATSEDIRP
jgi:hypothetical protein